MGMLDKPRRLRLCDRAWERVLCEGEEERESSSHVELKRFGACGFPGYGLAFTSRNGKRDRERPANSNLLNFPSVVPAGQGQDKIVRSSFNQPQFFTTSPQVNFCQNMRI